MKIAFIPAATYAVAMHFEGLVLKAYRDPVGLWTQGWGHLLTRDKADRQWPEISRQDADFWLHADMQAAAAAITPMVKVPLLPGQWGALVDFAFNLGAARLRASTLLRKVNEKADDEEILFQLGRWTYGGGARLKGLVRRRAAEAMLWSTGGFDPKQIDRWTAALDGEKAAA